MHPLSRLVSTLVVPSALAMTMQLNACDGEVPVELPPAAAPSFELQPLPDPAPRVEMPRVEVPHFNELGHFVPSDTILHAFRRTRPPIGAENGFSIRERTPEYFAITAPPARTSLRAMVEWEDMQALLLVFPGEFLSDSNATKTVVDIIRYGADHGPVWVLVDSRQAQTGLTQRLVNAGFSSERIAADVTFHQTIFDSIWAVDFASLPIIDDSDDTFAFADFRYYFDRPNDDAVPTRFARAMPEAFGVGAPVTYRMPLSTEGGTFQASTDGVCFTSSRQLYNMSCLDTTSSGCDEGILALDINAMQENKYALEMEAVLAEYVGCKDLIITHSVSDDGTGHLDMYFKLLDDERVLLGQYRAPFANVFQQENATLMDENAAFLEAYVRPNGEGYTVERLIMPGHKTLQGYGQVPFTYINSTFYNGINMWPATEFSDWEASRDEAQATWERVLPDMTHQWIDATNLSFYSGAIHCITRTIPDKAVGAWIADGVCTSGTCNGPSGGYAGACDAAGTDICFGPAWECECNDCTTNCEDPCAGIGYEGCCEDGDVVSCENGVLVQYDCGRSGCGWNDWGGYYDCGESGAESSGTFPIACGQCEPSCDGKTCGDDGCGGSCGTCSGDSACVAGACREDCFTCEPGEIGCDGNSAWICNEAVNGCKTRTMVDCGASGRMCEAGDCIASANPEPNPDVGPEPQPEAAAEVAEPTSKASDDGCGGGDAPLGGALLAGLALVWRSRAGRRLVA